MLRDKLLISTLFIASALVCQAQTSANSPQTKYGLGELSEPVFANNAAMGGIGYGLRSPFHINPLNPASYSAVDSLSFMFDAGLSLKSSNFTENGYKINARNASFDYLAMQFRLHPRLGMSVGYLPFSTVGYQFSFTTPVTNSTENVTATNLFSGNGNLQQIYLGLGWKMLKNLSIGANVSYLNGSISHTNTLSLYNPVNAASGGDQTINYTNLNLNSYLINLGLQYTHRLNKENLLTLGIASTVGHDLNVEQTKGVQLTDQSDFASTSENTVKGGYSLPNSYGVGLVWKRQDKWTIGLDYTYQNWSKAKHSDEGYTYQDKHKLALGAEFLPNLKSNHYYDRIRYRAGVFYNSPYIKGVNGNRDKTYGVAFGFGLPLALYQRNTVLNITGQFVRVQPSMSKQLSESRFVLKLGLTFNERWFMKWKVQ